MKLNYNALKTFSVVAGEDSFLSAAETLGVTQGAVAQQIRELEKRLGIDLFERHPRGVILTEDGKKLASVCVAGFVEMDQCIDAMQSDTGSVQVKLSVPPSLASNVVMPHIAKFRAENPNINLVLSATEKKADLLKGEADIVIRIDRDPVGEDLDIVKLADLDRYIVAAPEYNIHLQDVALLADFRKYKLIEDSHKAWRNLLGPDSKLDIYEYNQSSLALEAALSGQGVAALPAYLVNASLEAGRLVRVWPKEIPSEFKLFLIHLKPKSKRLEKNAQNGNDVVVTWLRGIFSV